MRACLWAKEPAAGSFRSAARLWGLRGFNRTNAVEITVCGESRPHDLPFRVHRADHHFVREITKVGSRRGIAILRSLLAGRSGGRAPTQSDLEDLFWGLVHARGLPIPKAQFPIDLSDGVIHVDFAYPEDGLLIECDGREWHGDRQAFERDRERDNELQALGYRVIRFTWAKLRYDPDYVEKILRRYLQRSL